MWEWFFKGFMKFLANMFSSSAEASSKRVNGTFCVMTVLFLLMISTIFGIPISPQILSFLKSIFWGGTALLGLGLADKYLGK